MSELFAYIYETNGIILGKYLFSVELLLFSLPSSKKKDTFAYPKFQTI